MKLHVQELEIGDKIIYPCDHHAYHTISDVTKEKWPYDYVHVKFISSCGEYNVKYTGNCTATVITENFNE